MYQSTASNFRLNIDALALCFIWLFFLSIPIIGISRLIKQIFSWAEMPISSPQFVIATSDLLAITDSEISKLLTEVYVEGGFTTPLEATSLFDPLAVRQRGILIGAREKNHNEFVGMAIVVPPDSPAKRLTESLGAELHLLGVKPIFRQYGLGRLLIEAAIAHAVQQGYTKISLWTQYSMKAAQKLYESTGFVHIRDFERNGRDFKVYERTLA